MSRYFRKRLMAHGSFKRHGQLLARRLSRNWRPARRRSYSFFR